MSNKLQKSVKLILEAETLKGQNDRDKFEYKEELETLIEVVKRVDKPSTEDLGRIMELQKELVELHDEATSLGLATEYSTKEILNLFEVIDKDTIECDLGNGNFCEISRNNDNQLILNEFSR